MTDWLGTLGSFLVHDLIALLLIPIVLLRRKESAAKIAWIFAILLMPVIGAAAFLLFGNDRLARRIQRRGDRRRGVQRKIAAFFASLDSPVDVLGQLQLYRLLEHISPLPAVGGNQVEIYTDMHQNYTHQLDAIGNAKNHIHIGYYIFQPDRIGEEFRDALVAAARRGVKVRFLYDGVGSLRLTRTFLESMESAGIEVACFIPFRFFTRRWIFNFRNHRKILVVDGDIGFVGGANVGLEYLGESDCGPWSDTHARIIGPAVRHLQRVFAEDWAFARESDLSGPEHFPPPKPVGDKVVQIVAGGPDTEVAIYHVLYFSAVVNAVERVRITTPYLVPSEAIMLALQTAARRGVDVQIMVPIPTDNAFVRLAGNAYYEDLLEAGVKIFEYEPGFLHSKVLTVDGRWSVLGTANFDNRSMRLNFEVGVVFYDTELTVQLDRQFDASQKDCRRLELAQWRNRALVQRIAENFAKLFSPIL